MGERKSGHKMREREKEKRRREMGTDRELIFQRQVRFNVRNYKCLSECRLNIQKKMKKSFKSLRTSRKVCFSC